MNAPSLIARRVVSAFVVASAVALTATLAAQIPTRNVNMVSGRLARRRSVPAAAERAVGRGIDAQPAAPAAGANDYRSVDLAGILDDDEIGDAWLGLFKSTDGGERWTSTLVPGYPQDPIRAAWRRRSTATGRRRSRGARRHQRPDVLRGPRLRSQRHRVRQERHLRRALHRQQQPGSGRSVRVPQHARWSRRRPAPRAASSSTSRGWRSTFRAPARRPARSRRRRRTRPVHAELPAGNIYVAYTVKSHDAQGDRWDLYLLAIDRLRRALQHAGADQPRHRIASTRARRSSSLRQPATCTSPGGASTSSRPTTSKTCHRRREVRRSGQEVQQPRRGAPVPARQEEGPRSRRQARQRQADVIQASGGLELAPFDQGDVGRRQAVPDQRLSDDGRGRHAGVCTWRGPSAVSATRADAQRSDR